MTTLNGRAIKVTLADVSCRGGPEGTADVASKSLRKAIALIREERTMTRYIIIDRYSGFVWGEANADTPLLACRAMDAEISAEPFEYESHDFNHCLSDNGGYLVYEADVSFPRIEDGQDEETIAKVERDCRQRAFVSRAPMRDLNWRRRNDEAGGFSAAAGEA